jgi:enoyl-CoA hydratase
MTREPRCVAVEDHQGIRVIVLDVPSKRNALSRALLEHLRVALTDRDSAGGHGMVVTGRGAVFSAGADLDELGATPSDRQLDDAVGEALRVLTTLDVPTLAAVEGPCIGAAVDIVLACDVVVAAEDAFFEVPALRHGLVYRPTSVARWYQRVPRGTLTRLLALGERLPAPAARDAGIVDVVTASGGAVPKAVERARMYRDSPAARSTVAMLRALDLGTFDAAKWTKEQMAMLESDRRRSALRTSRSTTRPAGAT